MRTIDKGALFAVSLTAGIIAVVAMFVFRPGTSQATPGTPPAAGTMTAAGRADITAEAKALQAAFGQREVAYQQQIEQVAQLIQERQATYESQIDELAKRITTGQAQATTLAARSLALQQQLAQLQSVRNQRLATYQDQLATAKDEYAARYTQLAAQIEEAYAKLAEANKILGK